MADKKKTDKRIEDIIDELLKNDPDLLKDKRGRRMPWEKPSKEEMDRDWEKYLKEDEEYMKRFEKIKKESFKELASDLKKMGAKINADKLEGAIFSANNNTPLGEDPVAVLAKSLGVKEKDLYKAMKNRGFVIETTNGAKGGKAGELWGEYREKYSIEFPERGRPTPPHYEFPIEGRLMTDKDRIFQEKIRSLNLESDDKGGKSFDEVLRELKIPDGIKLNDEKPILGEKRQSKLSIEEIMDRENLPAISHAREIMAKGIDAKASYIPVNNSQEKPVGKGGGRG